MKEKGITKSSASIVHTIPLEEQKGHTLSVSSSQGPQLVQEVIDVKVSN
jgi:hypothetical protein